MDDHYSILRIARNAPTEVVRAAYRVLAQKYHPDRNRDSGATRKLERLNVAYGVLSDPVRRAAYDRDLASRPEIPAGGFAEQHNAGWEDGNAQYDVSYSVEPGPRGAYDRTSAAQPGQPAADLAEQCGAVWQHRNAEYRLLRQRGVVIEHREWVDYTERVKCDGRLFVGVGRYIGTDATPKQTVWLRLSGSDRQLELERELLPVATGQHVTLVSVESQSNGRRYPLLLENHATQRWYTIRKVDAVASDFLSDGDDAFAFKVIVVQIILGVALLYHVRHWHIDGLPRIVVYTLAIVLTGIMVTAVHSLLRTFALGRTIRSHLAAAGLQAD